MPRQPRRKSNTGIYHIMLRGINRQSIFEDDHDRRKFVRILEKCREEVIDEEHIKIFDVYAWVIMGNHVHLVLRFLREDSAIEHVMKRICVAYSCYYNRKNARIGPVFQDRYRSEPIEDGRYLFNVVRYVHMNPVKAGMCDNPIEYSWSSYREYLHKRSVARIVDAGTVLLVIDRLSRGTVLLDTIEQNEGAASDRAARGTVLVETAGQNETRIRDTSDISDINDISDISDISNISDRMKINDRATFEKLTMEDDDGTYLEMCQERKKTISDDAARMEMEKYGCRCIEEFRDLGHDEKVSCIRAMIDKGASISQISRVTGISRTTLRLHLQRSSSDVYPEC